MSGNFITFTNPEVVAIESKKLFKIHTFSPLFCEKKRLMLESTPHLLALILFFSLGEFFRPK